MSFEPIRAIADNQPSYIRFIADAVNRLMQGRINFIGSFEHSYEGISALTTAGDKCIYFVDASSSGVTVNLPPAASVPRRVYNVKKIDSSSNVVTIDADGSETIDGVGTISITTQYDNYTVVSDGSQWFII